MCLCHWGWAQSPFTSLSMVCDQMGQGREAVTWSYSRVEGTDRAQGELALLLALFVPVLATEKTSTFGASALSPLHKV